MTPTAYQHRGKDVHTIVETALGLTLVAAIQRGIASVHFGPSEAALHAELAQAYSEAELVRNEEGLRPWIALLLDTLQGQSTRAPYLGCPCIGFQWKVWEALRAIPAGQTRSYRQVAQAIGQPTAARATARASATNPVAVFIPCHWVIRENGQIGGYRWEQERKERLLALEQTQATTKGPRSVSPRSSGK